MGGALRNAWKVSGRSGRLWTDNPPHHIIIPSALLSFCQQLMYFSSRAQ